jgi:F-type H+-transporting ATPase subunit b
MIARAATTLAAVLLALAFALPAWASGDTEHGSAGSQVLWQAVNLALILGIIVYAARKPAASFFKQRRETVSSDLDEAAELLRMAEARYASWNRKLLDLEAELEEIKVAARRRADQERERLLAEADAAAERIKADAVTAVEQELRRAQAELHDEASALAAELAATILRDQVQQSDRDRLLDEFITRVERIPVRDESGR